MSKIIHLQKATRIEGNANIHIEVENDRVKAARFMVQDFRAFEKFCQGKRIESVPLLVSRICGLCCTAHQVAGFRAVEGALGVETPPTVNKLREIALLGEIIASHSLSYFFLTLPDQLSASDGIFDLMKTHPDIAAQAFSLRKAGNRILDLICKRPVHPVAMGIGSFLTLPTKEVIDEVREISLRIKEQSLKEIEKLNHSPRQEKVVHFPVGHKVNFFTHTENATTAVFKNYDISGNIINEFGQDEFENNVSEMHVEWSFAKLPYLTGQGFPQGIMLVGPLSRLFNKGGVLDDPDIQGHLIVEQLRDKSSLSIDDFDICRLLELHHSANRILNLLEDLNLEQTKAPEFDPNASGQAIGVVEAPRGVLVHSYQVSHGQLSKMNLYVATQFNNAYINMVLKDLAEKHVEDNQVSERGQGLLSRCVRLFDPCLTCATH